MTCRGLQDRPSWPQTQPTLRMASMAVGVDALGIQNRAFQNRQSLPLCQMDQDLTEGAKFTLSLALSLDEDRAPHETLIEERMEQSAGSV